MKRYIWSGTLVAVGCWTANAFGHPQGLAGRVIGWELGWVHPWSGIDHWLAMVTVGVLAAYVGGRARWVLPAIFLGGMAAGVLLGWRGLAVPAIESLIGASVVMLSGLLLLPATRALAYAAPLVALAGLIHGHAHGDEMPLVAAVWPYFAGVLASTALLHFTGLVVGLGLIRMGSRGAWRSPTQRVVWPVRAWAVVGCLIGIGLTWASF